MHYRVRGLSPDLFNEYFDLNDDQLRERHVKRIIADEPESFPCRVSLEDASVGDEVLLLPFTHHDGATPYRSSGPIYVRRSAGTAYDAIDRIPAMQRRRLTSLRAYDASGFLVVSDVVPGVELDALVKRFLAMPETAWLHAHNARPGCFAFRIERA
ncbi:MAG TPA: DUF1203 domain-containing protein [Acidobacteriota bacterium]|nr:DUF1203 domain-containing protein [Acidobacteriota bacterium]